MGNMQKERVLQSWVEFLNTVKTTIIFRSITEKGVDRDFIVISKINNVLIENRLFLSFKRNAMYIPPDFKIP